MRMDLQFFRIGSEGQAGHLLMDTVSVASLFPCLSRQHSTSGYDTGIYALGSVERRRENESILPLPTTAGNPVDRAISQIGTSTTRVAIMISIPNAAAGAKLAIVVAIAFQHFLPTITSPAGTHRPHHPCRHPLKSRIISQRGFQGHHHAHSLNADPRHRGKITAGVSPPAASRTPPPASAAPGWCRGCAGSAACAMPPGRCRSAR